MLCLWPFRHVSIDQNGNFRPCCSWRHTDFIKKYTDVPLVNFNTHSIQDYIDSKFLGTIQDHMKKDQWPKGGCSDCMNEVSTSRAPGALLNYGFEKYKMGETFAIQDMEIKFGNKCNLGCVMCSPSCSSLLENEGIQNQKQIERYGFDVELPSKKYDQLWFERDDKMQELANLAKHTKLIRFTGGEPTVNGYLRNFLQYLKKHTTDIDIKLTTNGFKIPDSLLEVVNDFKSVWFDFSIDGYGKVNEFVRWPSVWNNICKNIEKVSTLDNSHISVKTTMHAMNVRDVGNICAWVENNDNIYEWDLNIVWEPLHLRPCLASEESKEIFKDDIKKFQAMDGKCSAIKSGIDVLTSKWSTQETEKHREKLDKYLNMLSSIRKVDWKEYIKV